MIDEANRLLEEKGYSPAHLAVHAAPLPGKALLKGSKIASPLSDTPDMLLVAVRDCVPRADELGRRTLTPHELRACLEA